MIACRYGFFGQYCTKKCNSKCNGCNDVNGLCEYGCHPGWKGDYCDEGNELHVMKFRYISLKHAFFAVACSYNSGYTVHRAL